MRVDTYVPGPTVRYGSPASSWGAATAEMVSAASSRRAVVVLCAAAAAAAVASCSATANAVDSTFSVAVSQGLRNIARHVIQRVLNPP